MDSSPDDDYYDIVHLFPTGEDRFDISNINYNKNHLYLCNSIGPTEINEGLEFITPCVNVATYLEDFYTKWSIKDEIVRCKYLNYSINDVLRNNRNHNYNEGNFIKAYTILVKKFSKCDNSVKVIEESVFKKVKELTNIYYEFNKYIKAISTYPNTECKDVSHTVELYLNILNRCKGETDKFCIAVNNSKKNYLSKISQIKCDNVEYKLKPFLTLDDINNVKFEEEEEEEEEAGGAEGAEAAGGRQDKATEGVVRVEGMAMTSPNQVDSSEMGQSKGTITTASSIILVLSSASFIFYKFTPLGTWLRPLVQRKNKKTISMYDEALRFNNNSSIQTNDSGNTEFNLQYHSS